MNSRIWFGLCSFFLIFNLKLVIDDYYLINYMIVNKNNKLYSQSNRLLLCILFDEIQQNDKLINEKKIIKNVSVSEFTNYAIKSIEFNLKTSNLFKLNQSFILYESICFLINKKEFEIDRPLNGLLEYYKFNFLYPDPTKMYPIYCNYIFQKGDPNLYNLKIKIQKIYDLNYLKNSNCLNKKLSNRIDCMNKCLDLIDFQYRYGFYNYLDDRKFNLKFIANNKRKKRNVNSFKLLFSKKYLDDDKYNELNKCFNKCPNNYCNFEIYNAKKINWNQFKSFQDKIIDIRSSIYLAYYLINNFWLQLFSLICLIIGCCFIDLLSYFSNSILNKLLIRIDTLNRRKYFKFIKFIFLVLFLIAILYQSLTMIKEYDYKSRYPNRTSYIDYSTKLPSLIICFPVQLLMFDYNLRILINYLILSRFTYKEIENKSNFNESKLINKIEFVYGNKKRLPSSKNEFNWSINNDEIYFIGIRIENHNHTYLSRCFRMELEYSNRLRYEYLNPIHYLEIEFKTAFWNLFIIDKNQNFTINSTEIKEGHSFRKIEISKLVKCNNLKNDKMIRINRCINKKFIDQFNSLPLYSLIDKNELINLNLSIDNLNFKFNLNRSNYNRIEADCQTKFNYLIDCNRIKFEETFKETQIFNYRSIRINLNYETYYEYEFEQSLTKLFLDIFNLLSISFGVSVIGLLSYLNKLIKFKLIKIIIISICLIGFLVHNFFIFKGIVDEKLSHSLYFEKLDYYKLPNILICIDLDKEIGIKIDDNYKLTPNYLNKITNQLNLDKVFHAVGYFNKTRFNVFKLNGDNMDNDEISIRTLYFLNFKCFEFKLEIEFTDNDFHVYSLKFPLKIFFNTNFIGDSKLIYILYRHLNSNQFSDLLKYEFDNNVRSIFQYTGYDIEFELIEINKNDNFELFKNPLTLLYGSINLDDTTSYLNNLRNQFKQLTNLTTREIMMEDDNLNLEIDDYLFKQYYLQIQNYTDHHYPKSSNLKQNYYDSQINVKLYKIPVIQFTLLSRKKKIMITNQDNNAKLSLNLLNTLALWLNICVLDLYKYFNVSIINPFKFTILSINHLIRLKIKLKNVSNLIILN